MMEREDCARAQDADGYLHQEQEQEQQQQQFWNELREGLSQPCHSHEAIDDVLRAWISCAIEAKGEHINTEYDVARCAYTLISSPLFEKHSEYVRRQIIFGLLQDDEPDTLQLAASFLLFDGQENESTYELMNAEGAFPRLVQLISTPEIQALHGLHRQLMDLLYEMGRIQNIRAEDLIQVDDSFVIRLFQIIEELSDDVNDPYHYPVIRLLLVLNEQFMVCSYEPSGDGRPAVPLTNKVIKIISSRGSRYKTFGENIILVLNRESETSLQLLTLKLLYLLFTTPSTHEYFYTNDLRVLVDILIRNLLDLPEEAVALRHTYLRVLYPLLAHTQLRYPPHYKREEIKKLLSILMRGHETEGEDDQGDKLRHFEAVDETTKRLVTRCGKVNWLQDEETELTASPVEEKAATSPPESKKPPPPTPRKLKKRNSSKSSDLSVEVPATALTVPGHLGMGLDAARESSLSVVEMAAQREKPGVITPSRKDFPRMKPEPPKARRSAWMMKKKINNHVDEHEMAETANLDLNSPNSSQHAHHHAVSTDTEASHVDDVKIIDPAASSTTLESPQQQTQSKPRQPPPMPKARRWRGKGTKEDDGDGGKSNAEIGSNTTNGHPHDNAPTNHQAPPALSAAATAAATLKTTATTIPKPPPVPVPRGTNKSRHSPKESVSKALSEAHVEAVNEVGDVLENTQISSISSGHHEIDSAGASGNGNTASISGNERSAQVVSALAPPAAPPPRGVRGPEFRIERHGESGTHRQVSVGTGMMSTVEENDPNRDRDQEHDHSLGEQDHVHEPEKGQGHRKEKGQRSRQEEKSDWEKNTSDEEESEDEWD